MATFFGSPTLVPRPVTRTNHLSSSSQPPPSQPPNQAPPPPPQPPQQLSATSAEPPLPPAAAAKSDQVKPGKPQRSTTVESTDWIASSLTRRFGLGAGLAWAGFLAFGVISEQIKTRLEVSQQEANTRYIYTHTHISKNEDFKCMAVGLFDLFL